MRFLLRAKIHKAIVSEATLENEDSITIDKDLMDKAGIWQGEKVLVVSNTTGARLETYVIAGKPGSGVICMNGASAHVIKKGEEIIIMSFMLDDEPIKPRNILVDKKNKFVRYL
jgi:aspartate 1-decarboxylase